MPTLTPCVYRFKFTPRWYSPQNLSEIGAEYLGDKNDSHAGGEVGERVREWVIAIRVPPKPHEGLRHPCAKSESQSDDSEKIRLKEETFLWAARRNLHISWLKSDIFGRVTQHTRIDNFCTNKKTFIEIYTRNTKKRSQNKRFWGSCFLEKQCLETSHKRARYV